ncbi:MAG: response regulator transcription factor [Actinomycetes bacterium]
MSTVLICDDSPLVREALRRVVGGVPGVDTVTTAGSGEEALARFPTERPDLVLMDVRMPGLGGVMAARRLLSAHPSATIVMLALAEDLDGVARAVGSGVRGYVVKDASREEVATVVGRCLADAAGARRPGPAADMGAMPSLTKRELQVLAGMSHGRSNGEIGRELFLSEDTIKTHARRLFRKLGASDRAHAVALGFRWGLVR